MAETIQLSVRDKEFVDWLAAAIEASKNNE